MTQVSYKVKSSGEQARVHCKTLLRLSITRIFDHPDFSNLLEFPKSQPEREEPSAEAKANLCTLTMGDYQGREPCPARILDDIGGAFAMGVVGGGIWHSVKGFRNAPRGWSNRLYYAVDAVKARSPVTGGSFATWGALFAAFDCTFAAVRHKEVTDFRRPYLHEKPTTITIRIHGTRSLPAPQPEECSR